MAECTTPKQKRKRSSSDIDEDNGDADDDDADDDDASLWSPSSKTGSRSTGKKLARKPKTNSQEVIDAMQTIHQDQKEAEKKRLTAAKQMHEQKMGLVLKNSNKDQNNNE